jgi:hypothetical protein
MTAGDERFAQHGDDHLNLPVAGGGTRLDAGANTAIRS